MDIYVELVIALVSGMLATIITLIVTEIQRKRNAQYEYKLAVFREILAYRTDLVNGRTSTGHLQKGLNEVIVAYNNSPKVIKAYEELRKSVIYKSGQTPENEKVISDLVSLFKAMSKELKMNYSFANDDLFTKPLIIGSSNDQLQK